MRTMESLIAEHGTQVLDHLDRQMTVAVTNEPQIQGDVSVLPITPIVSLQARTPIPPTGVAVVRGESGGHTHSLHASPAAFFDPSAAEPHQMVLGTLTVPDGSEAYLAHPEHGYLGIAPGTYHIGRQRELADKITHVED